MTKRVRKNKGKDAATFPQEDCVLPSSSMSTQAYGSFANSFINTAASLGTYNNKTSTSTFLPKPYRQPQHWINMGRGSWVAKRAVSVVADDMTNQWRTWRIEGDANDIDDLVEGEVQQKQQHAQHIKDIQQLMKQERAFKLQHKTNEALRLSRLFGGSVFLPILREDDLSTPLDLDGIGKGDLKFLHVLDPAMIQPMGILEASLFQEEMLSCEFYRYSAPAISKEQNILIHRSRLIFFSGEAIPAWTKVQNQLWDDSVLSCIESTIYAYHEAKELSRSLMMRALETIIKIPNLWNQLGNKHSGKLLAFMQQFIGTLSATTAGMLDKEHDIATTTPNYSGIAPILEFERDDLCGALEIPSSRLFGQTPSGLSASGDHDLQLYYDNIASKQEAQLRRPLELFDQILMRHTFGEMKEHLTWDFAPVWKSSPMEQSDIGLKESQALAMYLQNGVLTPQQAGREAVHKGLFQSITADDVEHASDGYVSQGNGVQDFGLMKDDESETKQTQTKDNVTASDPH